MWRVDDCFIHGCVFCYWMCRLVSHSFQNVSFFFFSHSFLALWLWIFDLSLPVGDKFF